MTLLDARQYDPSSSRRRLMVAALSMAAVIGLLIFWFWPTGRFRYRREWKIGNDFFAAIERHDFDAAFALYIADPDWKQHTGKYSTYTSPQLAADWGASGEFGAIGSHAVQCAIEPPQKGFKSPSGVVLVVSVNQRTDPALLWVEKNSGAISPSPLNLEELTRDRPLVRAFCYRLR